MAIAGFTCLRNPLLFGPALLGAINSTPGGAASVTLGCVVLGAVGYHYLASPLALSNSVFLGLGGGILQGLLVCKLRRPYGA